MNNKERKSQIDELNEELKKINEKIKDSVDTVIISGMYMKDDIEEKRKKTAENLNEVEEEIKKINQKGKENVQKDISKIKNNLKKMKEKISLRKEDRNKEKLEKHIEDELEYARYALSIAIIAAGEAKLAFLEAVDSQLEYDELYECKGKTQVDM